ncbi:hypothetical protein AAC387_Pa11g0855 [Persea americana]
MRTRRSEIGSSANSGNGDTKIQKRTRSESMLESLTKPPQSPVKRTSPRRCSIESQMDDELGLCKDDESMRESPSHHPPKSPLQTPVKWRSPRRCLNEGQKEDGNGNGHFKDTQLMPDSAVNWRSPRRCLNIGNENGLCEDSEAIPESPPKPPKSPIKWKSPRRCLNETRKDETPPQSPVKWRSPRRCSNERQKSNGSGPHKDFENGVMRSPKSPRKRLLDQFSHKHKWNPRDSVQINAVKEALHVSMEPSSILCREEEQKRVFEFCKACVEQDKAGSLYVCGCPGTGKTLSIDKVKVALVTWAQDEGLQPPDVLAINCTLLASTSEIFSKILERYCPRKKENSNCLPLQHLQKIFSQEKLLSVRKMMLIIIDEMDYLITKDRAVLHNLFMLTTYPFSRFILIGIANAIDLADRFIPKLQSLNCKPMVVTFQAYSKDQILRILQQRLLALGYDVFQPQALELCARKVAAASGDMRKALSVCRSAIEMLEAEMRDTIGTLGFSSPEKTLPTETFVLAKKIQTKQEMNIVRFDHMVLACSKAFKSAVVDTIQSLPQHQQIILCSAVTLFRRGKKDTTIGELNKSYSDICTSARIPPASILEFSNMCRVLSDQGLLKLGQRQKRVTLKVDEGEITFALQGIRFFQNLLL